MHSTIDVPFLQSVERARLSQRRSGRTNYIRPLHDKNYGIPLDLAAWSEPYIRYEASSKAAWSYFKPTPLHIRYPGLAVKFKETIFGRHGQDQ